MAKKLLVAQSGGPTPVINSALAGVLNAVNVSQAYDEVLGSINGIEGVIEGRFISMNKFRDARRLSLLKQTPSSYLGSCRKKLPADGQVYEDIFDIFKKNDICAFVYIGGNDSMDTVNKLSKYVEATGKDVCIIGVPKTIDNDLVLTDHTPGFGSAAKYITNSIRQLYLDTSVYDMKSIIVAEIMGRNAGWLTASASLANDEKIQPVDIICLPEVVFDEQKFLEKAQNVISSKDTTVIAVSEGICDACGNYISAVGAQDADEFCHAALGGAGKYVETLISKSFGVKTRSIEFSTLQRCSSETASLRDIEEAFEQGGYGVKLAKEGRSGVMAGITRLKGDEYSVEISAFDVGLVANKEKKLPGYMISSDGFGVTDEFVAYAKPLIHGQPHIIYNGGVMEFEVRNIK